MRKLIFCNSLVLLCASKISVASIIVYQDDLSGFNLAAGTPAVAIGFDSLPAGTDIAGSTVNGVTFSSPAGNTLEVVEGASTFTPSGFSGVIDADMNRLFPTSGANVLSPGGVSLVPGPDTAEQDSLIIDFNTPVSAFGIDVLFQSLDFASNASFQVFDTSFNQISTGSINTGLVGGPGGSHGGSYFMGFVSDDPATSISRIIITDNDGNSVFPDSNIGYDTLRIKPVPIPAAIYLFGSSLLVLFGLQLKRRS